MRRISPRFFNLASWYFKPSSEMSPKSVATDITADLEAALEQFATIAEDLKS
jgi:hypothetical protein